MRRPQRSAEDVCWHLAHTRLGLCVPGRALTDVLAGNARQAVSQWAQEGASQLAPPECEDTCCIIAGHDADVLGGEHATHESIVVRDQVRSTIGVRVAEAQGCAHRSYGYAWRRADRLNARQAGLYRVE